VLVIALWAGGRQYARAQLVLNGAKISINQGAVLYVAGDVQYESGSVQNKGKWLLTGGWHNNGSGEVFTEDSDGTVELAGAGTAGQVVSGTPVTFPRLALSGSGTKELHTDVTISRELTLGGRSLDVGEHQLIILNPAPGAIISNNGSIITSTSKGQLVRSVKAGDQYTFPLGARGNRYRPVICRAGKEGRIMAQFLSYDPDQDQYNRNALEIGLSAVNSHFYHKIEKAGAVDELTCTIPFGSQPDGDFETIARWNGSRWQKVPETVIGSFTDPADASLNKSASFTVPVGENDHAAVLALASLSAGETRTLRVPNVFTPNSDGVNEAFVIPGLEQYPENELRIINRWGNTVYREKNYTNKWKAEGLHDGTYFYWLQVTTPTGERQVYKGWVTVVH